MKKDNKGRKLQKGERQLETGRYEYRYTDPDGLFVKTTPVNTTVYLIF